MLRFFILLSAPILITALYLRPVYGMEILNSATKEQLLNQARMGDKEAQYQFALAHYLGRGVEKNQALAAYWFHKAAEQGSAEAAFCLGVMFDKGEGSLKQNTGEAIQWYQKAANQGHAKAQFNLGQILYEGFGTVQDLNAGAMWFERAALQGFSRAQYRLGLAYLEGKGVPKNEARAAELLKQASAQGDPDASQCLGLLSQIKP